MKKYDFAISYEIINREYESLTLLKKELERRGFSATIFQATALTKRINAEVVVIHSFYNNKSFPFIYYVFGKHQKIFNMRWEEIFPKNENPKIDDKLMPKQWAKNVSHMAWGKIEAEDLLRAGVSREKIADVGPLHLDLIKKDVYKRKQDIGKQYGIDSEKKWVLFISSLTECADFKENDPDLMGEDSYIWDDLSSKTRPILLSWFEKIIKDDSEIEVIYRPHPEETVEMMKKSFGNSSISERVHFITDEVVAQWIYVCDKVYNWGSTAGIQSYLMKKGNVLLRPIPIPEGLEYEMYDNSHRIKSYDEFKEDVYRETDTKRDNKLESYYRMDDGYSYIRLADYLEWLYHQNTHFDGIDYNKALGKRSMLIHFRNRIFRNFFVNMSVFSKKKEIKTT